MLKTTGSYLRAYISVGEYLQSRTTIEIVTKDAPIVFILYFLASIVYRCIYNLYFHPLSHFPGPFTARSSKLFLVWSIARGRLDPIDENMHKKYGDVVRKAPGMLSIRDPKLIPVTFHRNADKTEHVEFQKDLGILGIYDAHEHAQERKKVAGPFTPVATQRMRPLVEARVDEWIEKLGTEFADTGKPLDWAQWSSYLAYDIISHLCFGEPFGFVKAGNDKWGLADGFRDYLPYSALLTRLPEIIRFMRKRSFLRGFLDPSRDEGIGRVIRIRDEMIKKRLQDPKDTPDILSHLLRAHEQGDISMDKLKNNLLLFLLAGSDTTAVALRSLLIFLLTNPTHYSTLTARDLNPDNLASPSPKFPYLGACVKESLRCQPPASDGLLRTIAPEGLKLSDGRFIPGGTQIVGNPHVINRWEPIFGEDTGQWRPERWLEDPSKNVEMERSLFTFGYGARLCLGKQLAEQELSISTTKFFSSFEPELVDPGKPFKKVANYGMVHHQGIWISLKRRK